MPKALIVEDDPTTRAMLKALIQSMDCVVDEAADGEQAIERLDATDYDVILLDIVLPKVSGTAVMEHLHHTDPEKLERVIVVTGLNVDDIRKLFPSVCHALTKPVMPKRLKDSVAKCLGARVDEQIRATAHHAI
jgi:CheY-like chemotaxis protein